MEKKRKYHRNFLKKIKRKLGIFQIIKKKFFKYHKLKKSYFLNKKYLLILSYFKRKKKLSTKINI
jgi:hypothetical protein